MTMPRLLLFVLLLAAPLLATEPSICPIAGADDRATLTRYIQRKYNLAPSVQVGITELGFVAGSCFRNLRFTWQGNTRPLSTELIASPDMRFLTRALIDSHTDPADEIKGIAEQLAQHDAASIGPGNAPVTLVLFSDFECPFCSQMATGLMKDILPSEGENVRLIFRNFPLEGHPWARVAAEAMSCVRAQGDRYFWQLHDYIFSHQSEFAPETLVPILESQGRKLDGFSADVFGSCIDQEGGPASVDDDLDEGERMKISATPTLFVNGYRVSGYRAEQIRTLIREQVIQTSPK